MSKITLFNVFYRKFLFYFSNDNDYYLIKYKSVFVLVSTMANIQQFVINNRRTLKKTLSYYIMHISVAMMVAYVITGNFIMAATLSLIEPTVQAFAFFFHEKVWNYF